MEDSHTNSTTPFRDLGMAPILDGGLVALSTFAMTLIGLAKAAPFANSSFSNSDTSLTFIYQNNLNASDDVNHVGAILLDSATQDTGAAQCSALGESLLPISTLETHTDDFEYALSYLAYEGLVEPGQKYYVNDGVLSVNFAPGASLGFSASQNEDQGLALPVLCTQSSAQNEASNARFTSSNEVRIPSTGNTYLGFRNQKSFRFIGIPYANPLQRFEYSTVYNSTGQIINATAYGADCSQAGDTGSSENCLFLNIQTPYIPRIGSVGRLRPVMFSIHGGGFTSGNGGANSGLDGGNMASREDIVSVELNYRLSTLGFLAVPGTDVRGNFGIGDQITALEVMI